MAILSRIRASLSDRPAAGECIRVSVFPVMAAARPMRGAALSFASRFCAAAPRVCAPVPTYTCGHCGQAASHSTTITSTTHACPSATHSPAPTPLAASTHHHATPTRPINRRTELDYEELRALQLAGDIALIDVRDHQELEWYGCIPGSLNIPLSKIKTALQLSEDEWIRAFNIEKPDLHDRNLVFYARGPNASSAAVEIAHRLGFKRSRHYTGGWEDYCKRTGLSLKKTQDGAFGNYYYNSFNDHCFL